MYQERIILNTHDILEKDFKIDTKGYRPQEVDKFLDTIIRDYEEFSTIIREYEQEKKEIIEDNIRLKQEVRSLKNKLDVLTNSASGDNISNLDLLKRVSNLEKIIANLEKDIYH